MTRIVGLSLALIPLLSGTVVASVELAAGEALPLVISGWPLPDLAQPQPDLALGDDPVVGRQACPPLTRLNLETRKSEDLLLRRVAEEAGSGSAKVWLLDLRTGLFWWSGKSVEGRDLKVFLDAHLSSIVSERGGGLWKAPAFDVSTTNDTDVRITWKEAPAFGPYVLNGVPLWRQAPADPKKFECAGIYRMEERPFGIALTPTPGYKLRKPLSEIHLYKSDVVPDQKRRGFEFRYASAFGGTPWTRLADDAAPCRLALDVPIATMIVWNTARGVTADPKFRALMTQLLPRGALVRSAAASLGELLSAPIPRQHPGYDESLQLRSFDATHVSEALGRLGYKRQTADSPRLTKDGRPLKLVIRRQAGSGGVIEKVMVDAYAAVGIGVTLAANAAEADGYLLSVAMDWPRADLLGNLHSNAQDPSPFWVLGDRELDRSLEAYAYTLTTAKPAVEALRSVHKRLYELEPASVILQHKACMEPRGGLNISKAPPNTRDPDWFRHLVL